jgi:hypothetical protein
VSAVLLNSDDLLLTLGGQNDVKTVSEALCLAIAYNLDNQSTSEFIDLYDGLLNSLYF